MPPKKGWNPIPRARAPKWNDSKRNRSRHPPRRDTSLSTTAVSTARRSPNAGVSTLRHWSSRAIWNGCATTASRALSTATLKSGVSVLRCRHVCRCGRIPTARYRSCLTRYVSAPNYDEYLNVKFTAEDRDNLKKTGNLGRVAEVVDPATGELLPSFISIDRVTNETVSVPVRDINIPQEVLGAALDDKQQAALAKGEGVYVEGMTSKNNGKVFNATIQINADRRGVDFHFGERKEAQRQERTQTTGGEKQEQPRKLRIGSTLLQRPVTDEIKKGWEQKQMGLYGGAYRQEGKAVQCLRAPQPRARQIRFLPQTTGRGANP